MRSKGTPLTGLSNHAVGSPGSTSLTMDDGVKVDSTRVVVNTT